MFDQRVSKTIVLVAAGLAVSIFITGVWLKDPQYLLGVSQSFNQLAQGVSVILASVGAITLGRQYFTAREEARIAELKSKYPRKEFGVNLFVVQSDLSPGRLYLKDTRNSPPTVSHIGNRFTNKDLEFDDMNIQTLPESEFSKFKKGDRILTRGEPGT